MQVPGMVNSELRLGLQSILFTKYLASSLLIIIIIIIIIYVCVCVCVCELDFKLSPCSMCNMFSFV